MWEGKSWWVRESPEKLQLSMMVLHLTSWSNSHITLSRACQMQVISIIYADVILPRKTLDMLNTCYLCCFSVKKKTRNLKTCLTPWEMFWSAQVNHIYTTVQGKSKQITITQQKKTSLNTHHHITALICSLLFCTRMTLSHCFLAISTNSRLMEVCK